MITIELQDDELRRVLAQGDRITDAVESACTRRLQRHWASKIANDADQMVPVELSALVKSRQVDMLSGGFRITYGGMAAPYAKRQHEDESLQHTPPTTKYTYEGGGGGQGALNPPRKLGGKPWRYKSVQYGRRSPRSSHPINMQARDHWLHGRPHSAYEKNADKLNMDLTIVGIKTIRELLRVA